MRRSYFWNYTLYCKKCACFRKVIDINIFKGGLCMKTRVLKAFNLIVILCLSPIASAMQPEDLRPPNTPAPAAGVQYKPMPGPVPFYGSESFVPFQAPVAKPARGQRPSRPKSLEEQLLFAVRAGDSDAVNNFLQQGANPNSELPHTPLKEATRLCKSNIVQILLNNPQTNPNIQGYMVQSALDIAINRQNISIINMLAKDTRINVNLLNKKNQTPLDQVMISKRFDPTEKQSIIQLLRSKGGKTSAELKSGQQQGQAAPPPVKIKRVPFAPTTYALLEVPNNATAYEILHIDPTASDEEVKKAWRQLSLKWHPDKNPAIKEDAAEVFKLLDTAIKEIEIERKRTIK